MKKIAKLSVLVMVTVMVLSLAACSGGTTKTSSDTKKYVIATETTFKPFEYENEKGERVGIDIEL